VESRESAVAMERRLWASLGSSSDGVVDTYFNRPLGRFLSKILIHTPVTPNQVTVVSALIGLVSAWFFAQGNYTAGIIGALLLQLSALVDCVDGDLARVVFKESPIGKWLDLGLDQLIHVAVFATLAVGLSRAGADAPVVWLGISAVVGAVISFPVVVRARRLSNKDLDTKLEKFLDAASTRDFTALIVFLAVISRLEWFLWLTGITVHIFWITALIMQLPKKPSAGSAQNSGS
jgi:phosphatidylglycerophosphate synthase